MFNCTFKVCVLAALTWAAYRSRQVRVLVYDDDRNFRGNDVASSNAAIRAIAQICAQATAMQELFVRGWYYCFSSDAQQAVEDLASAATAQLAATALQLRTLKCQFGNLRSFPSMPSLKHLILEVRNGALQDGTDALHALGSLETLQIKAAPPLGGSEMKPSNHCNCPVMDLRSLSSLRSLSLSGVTPEDILVCNGCSLHMCLNKLADHRVWAALSAMHFFRSVSWNSSQLDGHQLKAPEDIPKTIREAWQLQYVRIFSFDWRRFALPAPLASVRVLRIRAITIEFHVPASVSCQEFFLHGNNMVVAF